MRPGTFRTARYIHAWLTERESCTREEITLDRDGTPVRALLVRPREACRPLPGWIVLHGITRRGPAHPQLSRFTRSVVSSGAVVIVPEVPEWMDLRMAPRLAFPTVKAAVVALRASGWARDAPLGVMGFSFGAPHAVAATGHPDLRDDVEGSVSFGGYCDLARAVRFQLTGTHEWRGRSYRGIPDPYGRWIVAANYLTAIEGNGGVEPVAAALRALAEHAADTEISCLDPGLNPKKAELRASLSTEHASLFDLLAPISSAPPDPRRGAEIADALVEAALKTDPALDPRAALRDVRSPVHLLHGRRDNLIPFSESLRLQEALPRITGSKTTITRLFGHSAQDSFPSLLRSAREVPVFVAALRRVLRLV